MLHVQVELLNHALLEVEILRLDSAKETGDVRRSRRREYAATDWESPRDGTGLNRRSSGKCRGRTGSWEAKRAQPRRRLEREIIREPLPAYVPRGVVVDGIASPEHGRLTAKHLPAKPDPRFESGFVEFDTHSPVGVHARDEQITCRLGCASTVKVKVRLAISCFGDRSYQRPCEAE